MDVSAFGSAAWETTQEVVPASSVPHDATNATPQATYAQTGPERYRQLDQELRNMAAAILDNMRQMGCNYARGPIAAFMKALAIRTGAQRVEHHGTYGPDVQAAVNFVLRSRVAPATCAGFTAESFDTFGQAQNEPDPQPISLREDPEALRRAQESSQGGGDGLFIGATVATLLLAVGIAWYATTSD